MKKFVISNSQGRSGSPWNDEFSTRGEAALAIREAFGWDDIELSDSFADDYVDAHGEHVFTNSWCCYETQEKCDEDQEGAYAPRITEIKC